MSPNRTLASIALAAALGGLTLAPSAAHAAHWSEVGGNGLTSNFGVIERHTHWSPEFNDALNAVRSVLPGADAAGYVALDPTLSVTRNSLVIRIAATAAGGAKVAWFDTGWKQATFTSEPRIDRQPNGTFAASASMWRYTSWGGWSRVWATGPSPSIQFNDGRVVIPVVDQDVSLPINTPLGTVTVNAAIDGEFRGWADLRADANGASGGVRMAPAFTVTLTGNTPVGTLRGTFWPLGNGTRAEAASSAGWLSVENGRLSVCGGALAGIHLVRVVGLDHNLPFANVPGFNWWTGFDKKACAPLI